MTKNIYFIPGDQESEQKALAALFGHLWTPTDCPDLYQARLDCALSQITAAKSAYTAKRQKTFKAENPERGACAFLRIIQK